MQEEWSMRTQTHGLQTCSEISQSESSKCSMFLIVLTPLIWAHGLQTCSSGISQSESSKFPLTLIVLTSLKILAEGLQLHRKPRVTSVGHVCSVCVKCTLGSTATMITTTNQMMTSWMASARVHVCVCVWHRMNVYYITGTDGLLAYTTGNEKVL